MDESKWPDPEKCDECPYDPDDSGYEDYSEEEIDPSEMDVDTGEEWEGGEYF